MADKRVIEQTASSELYNDDWFLKDSVLEGTTKISKDNLIDKIGASKIKSIAEDYDSTSTYNKDDFAFYENKLYRCLANNTTGTWDGIKWEEFDLPTALITTAHNIETAEFTIGTYYSADDLVLKDGKLYQCVVFHNATEWKSQFWREVTVDTMLEYLSNSLAPEHNPSTVYAVGDLVTHNKALWRCTQAGAGSFVDANWENVTVSALIAEAGQIDDVQVKTTGDYETVVENKIAKIDLSSVTAYGSVPNLPQAIATFNDGADAPIKSLKVAIEPQQDLHGYDSPWVGGAGKNKFKDNLYYDRTLNGVTFARQADGGIKITGTATQNFRFNYSNTVALKTGQYILSGGATKVEIALQGFGYVTTNEKSITVESDSTYESWLYLYADTTYNTTIYPMLRPSNTDSTFAPYSNICPISGWDEVNVTVADDDTDPTVSNIYTIDLDGTRYGGTLDVVSGVLTVDRAEAIYDGSSDEDWSEYDYNTIKSFRINISDMKILSTSEDLCMCDRYKYQSFAWANNEYALYGCSGHTVYFRPPNDSITSLSAFKTWLSSNNIEFIYPLATPLTIQLTPTAVKSLLGTNNIWADTGDITDAEYFSKEV